MMTTNKRNEQGLALVATLLVVTLLTVIVMEFTYSAQVNYHLAHNTLSALQASYLARSGINLAQLILTQDAKTSGIDSLSEVWAKPLPALPAGEGWVTVRISDEMGKLNLNSLRNPNGTIDQVRREVAERLFAEVGVDPARLDPLLDWLDADDFPEPRGAEKGHYLSLTPAYEPRNGPLLTLGELARVEGFTLRTIEHLRTVVSVLPVRDTKVNVNTAPAEVLSAIFSPDEAQVVDILLTTRQEAPFHGANEVRERVGDRLELTASAFSGLSRLIGARSHYFSVQALATVNGVSQALSTLMQRRAGEVVPIYWQPNAFGSMAMGEL
jgi:general secretion pathway protein K